MKIDQIKESILNIGYDRTLEIVMDIRGKRRAAPPTRTSSRKRSTKTKQEKMIAKLSSNEIADLIRELENA